MNNLHWKQEWFIGSKPYVLWEATWSDAGLLSLAQTGAVSITGVAHVSGNLGYALTASHNLTQVGRINLVGSVTLPLTVFEYTTFPFDLEGPIPIRTMQGALGVSGDLQYTVAADIPFNFVQVGAFTVRGKSEAYGNIEYTFRPDEPFDIAAVLGPHINVVGTLKALGQVHSLRGFELLTQPIGIQGALVFLDTNFEYPEGFDVSHVGEITLTGVLVFRDTRFSFEDFTEGLPHGWYVDGPILETVPNPNYGTAYGNAFFRRWTWKGYDPAGTMVAASGSEQDCFAQTLSVCQARHQEDWHRLSR